MSSARIWEVYGHEPRETVAVFFSWDDAASFAMRPQDFGGEQRSLYMTASKPRPNGWAVTRDISPDNGNERIAA